MLNSTGDGVNYMEYIKDNRPFKTKPTLLVYVKLVVKKILVKPQ